MPGRKLLEDELPVGELCRELEGLLAPVAKLAKFRSEPGDEPITTFEALLKPLAASKLESPQLADWLTRANETIARIKAERSERFGALVVKYLAKVRENGTTCKEQKANAWRIDRFVLELRPQTSSAQALYNDEVIVGWRQIADLTDLDALLKAASDALEAAAVPPSKLIGAVQDAFDILSVKSGKDRIKLVELAPELRLALARRQMSEQKKDRERALELPAMPEWRFLFLLDTYRQAIAGIQDHPLLLETGSQSDRAEGLYKLLGGLTPEREYTACAYLRRRRG
jgi:hypothetical protein